MTAVQEINAIVLNMEADHIAACRYVIRTTVQFSLKVPEVRSITKKMKTDQAIQAKVHRPMVTVGRCPMVEREYAKRNPKARWSCSHSKPNANENQENE